ncbi:MAG TPA: MFS transporter [Bacteroidia bacterium]|nr:MFS transporter [Bacteroidia bacterium]
MKNRSLITLISIFFFWGFVAASNAILIGLFKKNFELTQFQSQWVELAFYLAYGVGSLIYFSISFFSGDPLNKVGYKKGLITGLIVSAIGALVFIPAATQHSYGLMLSGLFIIGLGFALQQIVANPYVIAIGDPATGAHRVSLAGGINSFGTTIGPLLLGVAIYGSISGNSSYLMSGGNKTEFPLSVERSSGRSEVRIAEVTTDGGVNLRDKDYYLLFENKKPNFYKAVYGSMISSGRGGIIIANDADSASVKDIADLKAAYPDARLPILKTDMDHAKLLASMKGQTLEVKFYGVDNVVLPSIILASAFLIFAFILGMSKLPPVKNSETISGDLGAFRYPQVWLGMLAIFIYVGTEVTIQSNLPEFMRRMFNREAGTTVHFISLYWGSLMIGRWVGALTVFNLRKQMRMIMTIVVPIIAYGVILGVNYLQGSPMIELLKYIPFIALIIVGFFMAQEKPARTMILFGLLAAVMMTIGLLLQNEWSAYFFVSGGLFCSVMWPCIFSLSIAGLGKYTSQASSLLIMMIIGGALISSFQGYLSDHGLNIHTAYIVPLIGFLYLAFFGYSVRKALIKQGIDYDNQQASH